MLSTLPELSQSAVGVDRMEIRFPAGEIRKDFMEVEVLEENLREYFTSGAFCSSLVFQQTGPMAFSKAASWYKGYFKENSQ